MPAELLGNPGQKDLRAEAEAWLRKNPEVYGLYERFAAEMAKTGRRFGVKLLTERVRWECAVRTSGEDGFKINNNHTAYIARKLVTDHPELLTLLVFRETRY